MQALAVVLRLLVNLRKTETQVSATLPAHAADFRPLTLRLSGFPNTENGSSSRQTRILTLADRGPTLSGRLDWARAAGKLEEPVV